MLRSLKKPIIIMILQYIPSMNYYDKMKHSFSFQSFININNSTYHYINILNRELENESTVLFQKFSFFVLKMMELPKLSKQDLKVSNILTLYSEFSKISLLTPKEIDSIFLTFLQIRQPKYIYISCDIQLIPFVTFHSVLSSAKLIINASRFEKELFYNTLEKYQICDESLYAEFLPIELPNLERFICKTPFKDETLFPLLCEQYPKLKVLSIPIEITPTNRIIQMLISSAFRNTIEEIHLPEFFEEYDSILFNYLPRLKLITRNRNSTPLQAIVNNCGIKIVNRITTTSETQCIIY